MKDQVTITKLGIGIFMGRGFKKKGKTFLKDLDTIWVLKKYFYFLCIIWFTGAF